jgi:hypothetical protein
MSKHLTASGRVIVQAEGRAQNNPTEKAQALVEDWRQQNPEIVRAWLAAELSPIYLDPHPETGRRLVTVEQWANRPDSLVDECAYWFDPVAEAMGVECWRLVEGLDAHIGRSPCSHYDVLFVGAGFCTVTKGWPLYVTAKHYEVLQCGS